MARQQFDHQIKNTLEKREINPSAGSWDQLSQRLDSTEKKRIPFFWWAGIAASIVGGIFIMSLVFNTSEVDAPVVVETPSEEVINEENNAGENSFIASEEIEKEEKLEEAKKASEEENKIKPNKTPLNTNKRSLIASEEKKVHRVIEKNSDATSERIEENLVQSKLQEIIAEVTSGTRENADSTDAEINALLQKAAAEISRQHRTEGLAGGINAEELLFDVEMELEQSFREKVFDLLKEGYTKAKTAVANRTN